MNFLKKKGKFVPFDLTPIDPEMKTLNPANKARKTWKEIRKCQSNVCVEYNVVCVLKESSVCYDIGCSTGNLIQKINKHSNKKKIKFYGIEKEKKMYNYAKSKIKEKNIKLINKDFRSVKTKKSDLIISYYTLQFINPSLRQNMLTKWICLLTELNLSTKFVDKI